MSITTLHTTVNEDVKVLTRKMVNSAKFQNIAFSELHMKLLQINLRLERLERECLKEDN